MNLTQGSHFLELGVHSNVHTILFVNEQSYTYQNHSVCNLQENLRDYTVEFNRNRARCTIGNWLRSEV